VAAQKLIPQVNEMDKNIVSMNQSLLTADLDGIRAPQNMEQSSMKPLGTRGP